MDATATLALIAGSGCGVALGIAIGHAMAQRRWRRGTARGAHWLGALFTAEDTAPPIPAGLPPPLQAMLAEHADVLAAHRAASREQSRRAAGDALVALREADAARRARLRLLDAANHDLRQPLQALHLGLSTLRVNGGQHPSLASIEEAVAALQALADRWLQLARLDSGQLRPQVRACDLQDVFDGVLERLRPQAEAGAVRLIARARGRSVLADPALLDPMLDALVENAIRATAEGGSVLLTARDRRTGSRVEVRDNGVGIAPIHHDRVFEDFFQVGNSERDRRKGFGLGLAIAARLATLMGTRIGLCSRLHAGSCFFVELPRADLSHAPVALLVDPREDRRDWLASLLASWGWRTALGTSADAIGTLLTGTGGHATRVLVCAIDKANAPAWQAIEAALARQPALAVAVLCDAPDEAMVQHASRIGATLVAGPTAPAKLRALLARPASARRPDAA